MNQCNDFKKCLESVSVLFVEDENDAREQLSFFLENRVKHLYIASNGQEGLELYKEFNPDIVISDIRMPKLDGIEMSKLIKQYDSSAKIILTSAFNDSDYLFNAIQLGINNYLVKPIDLELLIKSIVDIAKVVYLEKENKKIFNTLEQYKDIVDERSIVSKTDMKGNITFVNEPFEKISGFTKDELLGNSHNIIRHEETPAEVFKDLWKTILAKETWSGVIKNKKKNGEYYIVDTIIKPILDIDGNIEEFIALRNDITDLENSKEFFRSKSQRKNLDLKESIRKARVYKEAINKSNIIIRVSDDLIITFVNDAFCKISGYTYDELVGEPYSIIKDTHISEDEYEKNIATLKNYLDEGNIYEGKVTNRAKDGTLFHCKYTIFPLRDKKGDINEYMGVRHDITEIENLHSELEDTQRELIYKLGEIGETRSKETGNHVKRVAEYSKLLAKKYGLSKKETDILFAASPMHDIGKVGIPDSILNKPGKLSPKEWEIMFKHCEIGYEILKSSNRPILQAAAIVSHTHHEKWNGKGYPKGLKEEEIHIFGRITAIADVFDALGSERVYKKAWPLEKILELFENQRAKHFDPKLVDLFFDNLDEFLEIRDRYVD